MLFEVALLLLFEDEQPMATASGTQLHVMRNRMAILLRDCALSHCPDENF
jgi:hypothetical protein